MAFPKFVAWENLPSPIVKPDAVGSSSSSSKSESGSIHEFQNYDDAKPKATIMKPEIVPGPIIHIPPSVKNVLEKLDVTQLERAKKDISKKLNRIIDNVNRTYERYRKDEEIDPEIEKQYQLSQSWEERSRRSRFLDAIADVLDDSKYKIQELQMVLESFKNLYESLKTIDRREQEAPSDSMIDEMEEHILILISKMDANIQRLMRIVQPLLDEKIKPRRRKSTIRPSLFKAWREKVADTPQEGEPLTLDRMLEDEALTFARCNEIIIMMQEMVDSQLFNRIEYAGIKYIASTVTNLTKAFRLLSTQCRGLKIKYESLVAIDSRKQDPQLVHLQRELRTALEKKAALEMQVHSVEERCKILLITNETMQKELQDANERAMLVSKVSFPKAVLGRAPSKSKQEEDQPPAKRQAQPIQATKSEEGERPTKKAAAEQAGGEELQATVSEEKDYLPLPPRSTEDGGIKLDKKDQEKDTFPELGPAAISSDKRQPEIAQKPREKKAPLEEEALKYPEEKSLLEKEALKSPEEKSLLEEEALKSPEEKSTLEVAAQKSPEEGAALEEAAQKSPEEGAALEEAAQKSPEGAVLEEAAQKSPEQDGLPEEEAPLSSTPIGDRRSPKRQLSEEKSQVLIGKHKMAKVVRRSSKLSQWKKLQTSLLKQSTQPQDEPSPSQPPEESSVTSEEASAIQPAPGHDTAESQDAILEDAMVTQPSTSDETSVTQPATLEDIVVAQPPMSEDAMVTEPATLHDLGESSPPPSVDSTPKTGTGKDSANTSEVEFPQPARRPAEAIPGPSVQSEGTRGKRKISLRGTTARFVQTIKVKKIVKFMGDSMSSDSRERSDVEALEGPQPGAAERGEESATDAQEAGAVQAQKRLTGKAKDIRERKDAKRAGKMLAGALPSKQEEKTEDVLHSLGTKLQEIARDRGGVINAETVKEVFEEMGVAIPDAVSGSPSTEKLGKGYMGPPAAEQAPKRERQQSLEEVPSGQDISSALQEFQTAILACIQDKLEKARKGPLGAQEQPVRTQLTDPQAQQLFQAIDKKLEECFSAKQKIPVGPKRQKPVTSIQSKGELLEEEEREIEVTTQSIHDTPSVVADIFSDSSLSLLGREGQEATTPGDASHLEVWEEEEQELVDPETGLEKKEQEKETAEQEKEQEMEVTRESLYQRERFSPPDGRLPKLEEEEEEYDQMSPPPEGKPLLEVWPGERHLQGKALSWERKKPWQRQPSDELQKHIRRRKEPLWKESKPVVEMESLQESEEDQALWQEQLQREKERLQEELRQLQEERQRLEEEQKHLEQWRQASEQQQAQWEFQQQQQQEQERLWQVQLQHWQHLQQENEEQAQHWVAERDQQKERQGLLQKEIEQLQEEYLEYLKMRGEQAEEEWRWSQLKSWHEQQEAVWQQEDMEREQKRCQWQEQLAQHEEQLEALRQERQEQEQALKRLQQEQQERQETLQRLWEKRWRRQLESWHRQMQRQRAQQHTWEEHSKRLQEKQKQPLPRRKEEKPPPLKLKVLEGSALEEFPKPHKASPASKERRPSTTPELTPIPSAEFEESALELEATWFPKLFSKVGDFSAPGITEKRYWMNVEAQRKNLEVLKEAAQKAGISPELYAKAKAIIQQALHSDAERLALLFQKYKSFHHLQEARRILTIQLDAAKEMKDGGKMQDLYKMVDKLDDYQKKILDKWTVKQNAVEKKRRRCLEKMIALFAQLRLSGKLYLSDPQPLLVKAGDSTKKEILHMPRIGPVFLKPKLSPSPLVNVKKPHDFTFSALLREPSSEQLESLWKTDITELSIPLGPKTPVSVLWSEACGFPDIPRLLELDISSIRKKPLQNLKTRIQNIPRWKISGYNFMHL